MHPATPHLVPRPSRGAASAFGLAGLALALLGMAAPPASAQTARPGDRVRVVSPETDRPEEGRLVDLSEAGLSYARPGGRQIRLEPRLVQSLEVARGKRHWGLGLVVGMAAGATAGAILKPTDRTRDCRAQCDQAFGDRNERFFSGVAGGAAGALAGAALGWLVRTESWVPVMVPWSSRGTGGPVVGGRVRF